MILILSFGSLCCRIEQGMEQEDNTQGGIKTKCKQVIPVHTKNEDYDSAQSQTFENNM